MKSNKITTDSNKKRSNRMATTLPIKKTESIFDEVQQMHDQIMKRAFEIFDGNGHDFGRDLENWLRSGTGAARLETVDRTGGEGQ